MTDDKNDPTRHLIGKRFGEPGGADPNKARQAGAKPWSVRNAINRIAAHEFECDLGDSKAVMKEINKRIFNGKMTGGQILAVTRYVQAMKNYKAMQNVVEDIDGKLIEKKVEATIGYAELVAGSLEQQREDDTLVTGDVQEGG